MRFEVKCRGIGSSLKNRKGRFTQYIPNDTAALCRYFPGTKPLRK